VLGKGKYCVLWHAVIADLPLTDLIEDRRGISIVEVGTDDDAGANAKKFCAEDPEARKQTRTDS